MRLAYEIMSLMCTVHYPARWCIIARICFKLKQMVKYVLSQRSSGVERAFHKRHVVGPNPTVGTKRRDEAIFANLEDYLLLFSPLLFLLGPLIRHRADN